MTNYDELVKDPTEIWLQSYDDTTALDQDRLWCEDKVWPDCPDDGEPTKYVRADLFEDLQRQLADAYRVHRWNVDDRGNGTLSVCRNLHEKGDDCEWEKFVPADRVEELERQLAEKDEALREVLAKKAADILTEYETAWGKPCDCRTANSALYYGRAQGLEIAAAIVAKQEKSE